MLEAKLVSSFENEKVPEESNNVLCTRRSIFFERGISVSSGAFLEILKLLKFSVLAKFAFKSFRLNFLMALCWILQYSIYQISNKL
jgi:hypothetical protein